MLYTKKQVLDYVREEDVKFIRLAFCDVFGVQKNISILAGELEHALEYGESLDASAICGFDDGKDSDLFLFPDPSTLSVLPWRPSNGCVVRMFCDIKRPDGSSFEADCRALLKKAVNAAAEAGVMCRFGVEQEFYLFKTSENGEHTFTPLDNAGYMDIAPEDAGENVRREICLTLEQMDISPQTSHHEEGPGQNEIDFRYGDAITAADDTCTFKTVVKTVAAKYGLWASFDPKPLPDASGNGMHINISPSLADGGECFEPFMAGIMEHISEITLFLNPSEQSYLRLRNHMAPRYVAWSHKKFSQIIRIPAAVPGRERIELRSPDTMSNPYIAFALLIFAGLDGVKRGLALPPEADKDAFLAEDGNPGSLKTLPAAFSDAVAAAKESAFLKEVMPAQILEAYYSLA